MKKTFLFAILILFASHFLIAQPACLKDIIYTLSLKQYPKAQKMMEECFAGNESSADAWLVRANVYIQLYKYEQERNEKDAKYAIRFPDALIIANESFYKAIELKPDVKTDPALLGATDGQLLSATPIHQLARITMENNDCNEAIKLLNMVIRSYKADPKGYAEYLAYACVDMANCYKTNGDEANYKKILTDAAKMNLVYSDIYLNLYDLYKQEKDTVKCGEILNQARKLIIGADAINVRGYELDYYAMIGDTAKLKEAAIKMYEENKTNPAVIMIVAGHLINNKEYLLAEEMIQNGLQILPDDFDLNQLMGYRYNCEALDYVKLKEDKLNETPRKYTEAEAALNKSKEIFQIALPWAEKAYNLNPNDRDNNVMLSRIYVRLELTVPEELQQKINSYYQKQ
jgi:hypothetical protein